MVRFRNINPERDKTTPLNELWKLNLLTLEQLFKTTGKNGTKTEWRYLAIQARIVGQGLARNLPTYLLYRYQFDDLTIPELAEDLEVSSLTLSKIMRELNIPIKTVRDWRIGSQASAETRVKMSGAHEGHSPEAYDPREIEIIDGFVQGNYARRFEAGTYNKIQEVLKAEDFDRSIPSLRAFVHGRRYPESPNGTANRRPPLTERTHIRQTTRKHLTEIIEREVDRTPVDEDTEEILERDGNSRKRRKEKREHWYRFATPGHMKLLIFLSDHSNSEKYIEKGLRRVATDFQVFPDDVAETRKLYNEFREKVLTLDDCTAQDLELSRPGWMRCDMIFRRRNGEYLIVEVKQFAKNRGRNRNGDRTLEQLHGYVGGFTARIVTYNFRRSKRDPDFIGVPRFVHGCVAAYEVQEDLKDLSRGLGLTCVEIPQRVVDEYIDEKLDDHVENKRKQEAEKTLSLIVVKSAERYFAERLAERLREFPQVDFYDSFGFYGNGTGTGLRALLPDHEPLRIGYSPKIIPNGKSSNSNGVLKPNREEFRAITHRLEYADVILSGGPIAVYHTTRNCLQVRDKKYLVEGPQRIERVRRLVRIGKLIEV